MPTTDTAQTMRELLAASRFREAVDYFLREFHTEEPCRPEFALLAAIAATRIESLQLGQDLASDALSRFTATGDRDGRMRALNLLGAIHFKYGRLAQADQSFSQALRLSFELEDTLFIARTSNNRGAIADLRGDPHAALALYRSALLSYQRLGDRRGIAETCHNLSIAYRQLGRWVDAEQVSGEAVRHADLLHEHALLALAICGRAELHLDRGEIEVAARSLDRASHAARTADNEVSIGDVLRVRALVALKRGHYEAARASAERARSLARRHGNALLLADANAAAALALRGLGLERLATKRYESALDGYSNLGASYFHDRFQRAWAGGRNEDRVVSPSP